MKKKYRRIIIPAIAVIASYTLMVTYRAPDLQSSVRNDVHSEYKIKTVQVPDVLSGNKVYSNQ